MIHRLTILSSVAIALALAGAPAAAADPVTPEQKQSFEQLIYDYLMNHPEVLVQALQDAEERMKRQDEDRAKTAVAERQQELVGDPTSPVGGDPKGDVTIVEFFDYRCPYCKQVEPALAALLREDGHVRIVYKEFPILGKDSVYASRVALAARRQGKYDAFHAAMMAAKGQTDERAILQIAAAVGLDLEKVKADMNSAEIDGIIKRNFALAQALDIRGTPGFVIGGEIVPGAIDVATMKQKIAAARKG